MVESLRGRVAIVTGASGGIGRAIAGALAADGMSLLLLARGGAAVRELADELSDKHGARCLPAAIDVADRAAVDRVVMHAEQQLGAVDLLVNCAGAIEAAATRFWESDPDELWRVVETNLRGPVVMTHAVLAAMVQRGRGHIVNIASRATASALANGYTGYAVSKRGLSVFTQTVASQLDGTGVVILDVLPGLVRTAMTTSMPVWDDTDQWDPPALTAKVVADVARGRYDDRAGEAVDATTVG